MADVLTVNEVVAFAEAEPKTVWKDVERGLFGSKRPPRFGLSAIVFYRALSSIQFRLQAEDRRKVYVAIKSGLAKETNPAVVQVAPLLELKVGAVTKKAQGTLKRFEAWKKKRVVTDPEILGGEPVFLKSRLAVRRIGGLAMKGLMDEVREDYPYLKPEDIEFAKLYTVAYPRMGRPRVAKVSSR